MKLEHIKEEFCSVCGSVTEEEKRKHPHSNGEWNEYREFACGKILHYSPNLTRVLVDVECPNTSWEKEKRQKRDNAKEDLLSFVEELDVDDGYKEEINSHLRCI